jgi:raffinose/stachyose/melibiose transport system substrate-binding protein
VPNRTTRRRFLAGAAATAGLAACGSPAGSQGRTTIRLFESKTEVIDYVSALVAEFNESQSDIWVVHDSSQTSLTAQFVRNAPPDVGMFNYNLEAASFVSTGVLEDLSDLPEAATIDPQYQGLVDQFANFEGETSVLPYSITAAGVLYNTALFDQVGLAVPTTWSELITVCQTLQGAGIVPVELTSSEVWTLAQGLFDYTTGSAADVAAFYEALKSGEDVTFLDTFGDAGRQMVEFAGYANPDNASRTYPDGNLAFGRGEAAMYLQGPWALNEVSKVDPDLPVDTFPMPATEDPEQTRSRVNLDLALWIPTASPHQDEARVFLQWLMSPDVIGRYNGDNLASSPLKDAPPQQDPRMAGLQESLADGRIYQGANTYIPPGVPVGNYVQEALLSGDSDTMLRRLDEDWGRLAARNAV